MFSMPDLGTLRLCSFLASTAFGLVFAVLWLGRRQDGYMLHWSASSLLYAMVIAAFDRATSVPVISVLMSLLGVSNILLASGLRRLQGRAAFAPWMLIPATAAGLGSAIPGALAAAGFANPVFGAAMRSLGLALSMGIVGVTLLRGRVGPASAGCRIAGCAMLGYIPGYVIAFACEVKWLPGHNALALIPMLSDQLLLGLLNLGLLAIPVERASERLRQAALRDPLTGAWNRAGLQAWTRSGVAVGSALVAIDIDHFKRINDDHGHAAGDEALVALAGEAERLAAELGGELVRLGGDEFVAILPAPAGRQAETFAERLRLACQQTQGPTPRWTISVGVARVMTGDAGLADALKRADLGLYRAKAQGRNRIAA